MNIDKTRAYIERSRSSPLKIHIQLNKYKNTGYLDDALPLAIPHLRQLKSLTIYADVLPGPLKHFCCQTPLLEELDIHFRCSHGSTLDRTLFDGDLSSLRKLTLSGAIMITHLPWNNMKNLQVFSLKSWSSVHSITQLLDFLESVPLLHTIKLNSVPDLSDAPPQRMVCLSRLKALTIDTDLPHSILLNHVCIPTGASLILRFYFSGQKSPLLDYLPEAPTDLKNLSHITTINLLFDSEEKFVRLSGPSGSLHLFAYWQNGETDSHTVDRRILHSLDPPTLSTTQRLVISKYRHSYQAEGSPIFRCLSLMNSLRTLILTECNNSPFILALDPEEHPSKLMLCPNLEELVLYVALQDQFQGEQLISMAKNRASGGVQISSITIVGLGKLALVMQVPKLEKHVTCVTYRVDKAPPAWDHIPGESGDKSK